ncbi:restriction endonuclease subunit S domain-containing protein [Mycoplasma sp. VS30B]
MYRNTIYVDDNIYYKQISVRNTGQIDYRDTKKGISIGRKRQYVIDLTKYPNTLIFTRQSVYNGGIGFVPKELNGAIVTENMPMFSIEGITKSFMTHYLNTSHYFEETISSNPLIGSAQKALHENMWIKTKISVPKVEEQEKIGVFLDILSLLITFYKR